MSTTDIVARTDEPVNRAETLKPEAICAGCSEPYRPFGMISEPYLSHCLSCIMHPTPKLLKSCNDAMELARQGMDEEKARVATASLAHPSAEAFEQPVQALNWVIHARTPEPGFPHYASTVPYIFIIADNGEIRIAYANTTKEKDAMILALPHSNYRILAVWPGQWKSDVFEIDRADALIKSLERS